MTKIATAACVAALMGGAGLSFAACDAAAPPAPASQPWMQATLSPDAGADMVLGQMTQDEKIAMVTGSDGAAASWKNFTPPAGALGSAGYIPAIPRLGIPAQQETDAGIGVAWAHGARPDGYAVSLPSGMATTATWNPETAFRGGAMIGKEASQRGFDVMLAGGVDLVRDPRNGRNFEYGGEDPLLAGMMVGAQIRGIQSNHVISTVKHYAVNDQETGRNILSSEIDQAAARESDLLAFQIAIEQSDPGSVMCSYNKVGGTYACENDWLLNKVLKGAWRWPGYVMSDWGAVHSTAKAANAGLDQESAGSVFDDKVYFGDALKGAIARGEVPQARLDDMVRRILRTLFARGVVDHPPVQQPIDFNADAAVSQADAEQGAVLLKNTGGLLPLARTVRRIAVIGGHADVGVMSGGGSSQVMSPGGSAVPDHMEEFPRPVVYHPSSPLKAIQALAPGAQVRFADGRDRAAAARLAADSDVVIVFATQWTAEAFDAPDLSLPDGQDALVAAVAAANPHTVVVLETGGPVLMPWLDRTGAVLEAWYPGARGGEAIARLLFGEASPSGRLPVTFPQSLDQLPRAKVDGVGLAKDAPFEVRYDEGAAVGYKWFGQKGLQPLFPFGHGLTYSRFAYSGLQVRPQGASAVVRFTVSNTGARAAVDTPQVYAAPPGGAGPRLVGWTKAALSPGQSRQVEISIDPRLLARFDGTGWKIAGGAYQVMVGASSGELSLKGEVGLPARSLPDGR